MIKHEGKNWTTGPTVERTLFIAKAVIMLLHEMAIGYIQPLPRTKMGAD